VSSLVSAGVLTSSDQQRVGGWRSGDENSEMLLDLIARKSQTDFDQFIDALRRCHNEHVAEYLLGPQVDTAVEVPRVDVNNLGEMREAMQQTLADDKTGSGSLRR